MAGIINNARTNASLTPLAPLGKDMGGSLGVVDPNAPPPTTRGSAAPSFADGATTGGNTASGNFDPSLGGGSTTKADAAPSPYADQGRAGGNMSPNAPGSDTTVSDPGTGTGSSVNQPADTGDAGQSGGNMAGNKPKPLLVTQPTNPYGGPPTFPTGGALGNVPTGGETPPGGASPTPTSAATPAAPAPAAPAAPAPGDTAAPAGGAGSTGTGSTNPLSWTPTSGIVDQVRGITPQTVDGQGYTSGGIAATPDATSTGYDATGYTAQQGTAATSSENVSSAVDRIINENSPLMQRARSQAMDQANDRGLLNTTMAGQAGEAAVLDQASTLAAGDVQNAQFNAQEQNVMTINNVNQANAAAAFHADATNQAAQFAAAAKNSVSQFNSAQAQQKAIAAAQLWDQAAQFSAAAKQAAETFNADAYNKAMQSYVDAKNAATAAQNDAENLSRRDTAQINAGLTQAQINAKATTDAANAHAAGMVGAAQISAAASESNTAASIAAQEKMQGNALTEDMQKYNMGLTQQQQQWAASLSATQFNTFQSGYTSIMTSQMEPDAKQNAISNYMAMWTASGTLPFDINPPASTTTGT